MRLSRKRVCPFAEAAEVRAGSFGLAAPADKHQAALAASGFRRGRLAGGKPVEIETDIFPVGALGRDADDPMLAVGGMLAEVETGHCFSF